MTDGTGARQRFRRTLQAEAMVGPVAMSRYSGRRSSGRVLAAIAGALLLVMGGLLAAADPADAATVRPVRLEAGPHTGYRFSSTGAITARKAVTLSGPTSSATDRRRVVPAHTGIWMRLTTGTLAGYEVRESAVAYIPGKAGDTVYSPEARVVFPAGRYLGYTFDASWDLGSTRYRVLSRDSSARASRRAIIDGRPYVLMSSGIWDGTWMPVTQPRGLTAQGLRCTVPSKPAAGTSVVLRRVSTGEARVALTFDLGGRLTPALDILERLVIDRVCTTIFPTGDAIATMQGTAAMAMVRAHPELFEVGNHTQHHCNLRDGGGPSACPTTPPSATRIRQELLEAEATIRSQTGMDPRPYWRPPYGAYDDRVRSAAAAAGYPVTVMWAIDTIDWRRVADGGPTAAQIAAKVVTNARTGSIVLMHLGGWHTYDALPSMVLRLRAAGLEPSAVTDLLR